MRRLTWRADPCRRQLGHFFYTRTHSCRVRKFLAANSRLALPNLDFVSAANGCLHLGKDTRGLNTQGPGEEEDSPEGRGSLAALDEAYECRVSTAGKGQLFLRESAICAKFSHRIAKRLF